MWGCCGVQRPTVSASGPNWFWSDWANIKPYFKVTIMLLHEDDDDDADDDEFAAVGSHKAVIHENSIYLSPTWHSLIREKRSETGWQKFHYA